MIELKQHRGMSMQTSIDSYVRLFWDKHGSCQVIVMLETSFDGEMWSNFNAIAFPLLIESEGFVCVSWLKIFLTEKIMFEFLAFKIFNQSMYMAACPRRFECCSEINLKSSQHNS